jgi:GDP-L-fucose synthase
MSEVLSHDDVIFVAGHRGMVGSAAVRELHRQGFANVLTAPRDELDLRHQESVRRYLSDHQIDNVLLAAGKVGGIHANNTYPAQFIYDNLMIECNVIHSAYCAGVKRLLFLGSSCIYPKHARQPMAESELLSGVLEPTNEPYAIAKIAGIKLCESYNRQHGTHYRSLMPTNLYGEGDNFHPEDSHVIPALMRRFHEAKLVGAETVEVWGTGNARREFLHVDDLAAACVHVMGLSDERYEASSEPMASHINVGTGEDVTIRQMAETLREVVGLDAELRFDTSRPDGTPRKLLDVSRLAGLGWRHGIGLREGLQKTYNWFLAHLDGGVRGG